MKCILARLTVRLVSAILFVAKYSGMIEGYSIDKAIWPGIFNRIRVEWAGESGNELVCRIEALGDFLIWIELNGARDYYASIRHSSSPAL